MEKIYTNMILERKVGISPKQLKKAKNIDEILLSNLKNEIDGKCIHEGYVRPNSIKIYERSIGSISDGHFNGNMFFNIRFSVNLCNPAEGSIISCTAHSINKMGILGGIGIIGKSPLLILLARQHHIDNDLFSQINEGDSISIEIIGKKYELGDKQINVIAELKSKEKTIKMLKKKKKKKTFGGGIFNNQNKEEIYRYIISSIKSNENINDKFLPVINDIRENIDSNNWEKKGVSEKNGIIGQYLKKYDINFLEDNEEKNIDVNVNSDEDLLEV